MSLTCRRDGPYGYVTLDSPPVNAIGQPMRAALLEAVHWAEAEGLDRVILSGAGRGFAAGADAREFDSPPAPPHLPDVLNRIEASPVPWIAAVHGAALGGGAELALACRYRIATPDAQIGFPEVVLGVVPGAGGTQRLPRLVGFDAALHMIPTGKPVAGTAARDIGLVDALDADPVEAAEMLNSESLGMAVPVGTLNSGDATDAAFAAARDRAARKLRGQTAPGRAIDLLDIARGATLEAGMQAERETFLELRGTAEARALRHIFFAERGARQPAEIAPKVPPIRNAAVVGGGTMGTGIAYALSSAGIRVTLLETDDAAAARAQQNLESLLAQSQAKGALTAKQAAQTRKGVQIGTDYGAAREADLAIEAVFEDMAVKTRVLAALQDALPANTVLATNTSYLDVDALAATLDDPTRAVGLHFFAPAYAMKLLEIVHGHASSGRALATGYTLARQLRKIPVLAGPCDGFIGNRILARYREAADTVLMDGATPWEIDEAMVDFGYPMGPYEAQDISGLDIAHATRRRQDATRDPNRRYIPIADRMIELGKLGRKTGAGWYRYPGGGGKVDDPIVADLAIEEAHFAGVTRRDFSPDEIRERLLTAMINEAADILYDGIAQSASDIDLVTVHGYGFPRWRGGLMHHADSLGATTLLERLHRLSQEDPLAWRPSPLIAACADRGIALADWRAG